MRDGSSQDGGPRWLAESVPQVLRRIGAPSPTTLTAIFSRWEEVAGEALARHVEPVRIDGPTLFLSADHPIWATRARIESGAIVERVNALSDARIERVEVVVRRP